MSKSNYKLPDLPGVPQMPSASKSGAGSNSSLTRSTGFNKSTTAQPINFGRASRAATRNPPSTSTFSKLLSGSSSGLGGAIAEAAGFSLGIGTLISGLVSVFGGGKTAPPALTAYQLPASQNQTISTTGSAVSTPDVYGGPAASSHFSTSTGGVVQTVKQALLNSSSLNDVIGEL